jgi:nucleotide-binding universal stress UspA family protein
MFQVRKIVVPTDFSPCSAAALDRAADLAKALQAEILLLHVLPNPASYAPFPHLVPMPEQWLDQLRKEAKDRLAKESQRVNGPAIKTELREGPFHDAILAAVAAAKADLIVIGTHGRTGIKHALMGSVAERVVRIAPVPVLTVRSPE